ncbi:MAG: sulfite exporter TauE/SafE family protein [Arenicellales bacterium]
MNDMVTMFAIGGTFLLAGTVKGIIGMGLPTISLALLTIATDLPTAMALLLVPSFFTNIWQALVGGNVVAIVRRIWPFLTMAAATVWLGVAVFARMQVSYLSALLGFLLITYSLISLGGFRLTLSSHQETWAGPLVGAVNGVLTGMTGSFVVPGVMFLQSIGLSRDQLIQAMGALFTVSTLALAIALQRNNMLSAELGVVSGLGLFPAILGMMAGQWVRRRLSEVVFRRVFFISLFILGGYVFFDALRTG